MDDDKDDRQHAPENSTTRKNKVYQVTHHITMFYQILLGAAW